MRADSIVHVMRVAAVGAGDLLDAACLRLFRVAQQIEFELLQRSQHSTSTSSAPEMIWLRLPNSMLNFPFCSSILPRLCIFPPQAEQVFWRIKGSFPSKTPSAPMSRGRNFAVPPLVRRLLAKTASTGALAPRAITGAPDSPLMPAQFRGQLREVFPLHTLAASHHPAAL